MFIEPTNNTEQIQSWKTLYDTQKCTLPACVRKCISWIKTFAQQFYTILEIPNINPCTYDAHNRHMRMRYCSEIPVVTPSVRHKCPLPTNTQGWYASRKHVTLWRALAHTATHSDWWKTDKHALSDESITSTITGWLSATVIIIFLSRFTLKQLSDVKTQWFYY